MENLTFAFVMDGDVFHYLQIPNDPRLEGVIAGLSSGPQVVPMPEGVEFMPMGTRYENGEFVLPEVEEPEDDYEVED